MPETIPHPPEFLKDESGVASLVDAWALTRALSPRRTVRLGDIDSSGQAVNEYSTTHPVSAEAPSTPWAMNLAGPDGHFRFVCFDLDASRGNAAYDAGRLSHWLDELNIEHLICISGPSGGRHVWIALEDPVDAALVYDVAQLAGQLLPSLDRKPLLNPATGCVRPPGAPHRHGGHSRPQGPVRSVLHPSVSVDQIADLRAFLLDAGAELVPAPRSLVKGMAYDKAGQPYVTGARRPLSARMRALMTAPPAADASYTLNTLLTACAQARWRHADVLELVEDCPALEHVRTARSAGQQRVPRGERAAARVLTGAWYLAVYFAASNPVDSVGDDDEYQTRAIAAAEAISRAQDRANLMPGLWGLDRASQAQRRGRGSYRNRAVFDALCLYMMQASRLEVEADERRLSADTGWSKESARLALHELTRPLDQDDPESAWIIRVPGEIKAPHGQRYRLSEKFSTETQDRNWSQVPVRPSPHRPPTDRTWWINHLSSSLSDLTHDVFAAPGSLGRTAGTLYTYLRPGAVIRTDDLSRLSGLPESLVRSYLQRLELHKLVQLQDGGLWSRTEGSLEACAVELGVFGYLEERKARYDVERGVWAWWLAEYGWMKKRGKKRRSRRSPTGVPLFSQNDRPDFARYPRGPNKLGNHREARKLVEAGILDAPRVPAAA